GAYRRRRGCSAATPRWSTFRRMSPPTEHPPAGIRIARSSNRPDLAQKAGTATQKIKVLTEKMAMQHDGPSSKYTASRHTNLPLFATRERTSTSVAARPGRTNLRTDYRCVTRSRSLPISDVYSARHTPFGRKRRGPLATSRFYARLARCVDFGGRDLADGLAPARSAARRPQPGR